MIYPVSGIVSGNSIDSIFTVTYTYDEHGCNIGVSEKGKRYEEKNYFMYQSVVFIFDGMQ